MNTFRGKIKITSHSSLYTSLEQMYKDKIISEKHSYLITSCGELYVVYYKGLQTLSKLLDTEYEVIFNVTDMMVTYVVCRNKQFISALYQ